MKKFLLALIFVSNVDFGYSQFANPQIANQTFCDTLNSYRNSLGLNPVSIEKSYYNFVSAHSHYQANINEVTHGSGNSSFENRLRSSNIKPFGFFFENCTGVYLWKEMTIEEISIQAFEIFKGSPPHNSAMISPDVNKICVAYFKIENKVFVTLFLTD
jgi:uncharacterized protein YkwD